MGRRALFLINAHARQAQERKHEASQLLLARGFSLIEASAADFISLSDAVEAFAPHVDLVVIAGGDGTLNRALRGLLKTQLPLGILPLGTGNDLARTLGIPFDVSQAVAVISNGHLARIDLGMANQQPFLNVASVGLTVSITQNLRPELKKRCGVFAYVLTAARAALQARPFRATICADGCEISVKTIQIAVGNGRFYGGGLSIAPDASITDNKLDFYSVEVNYWWQALPLLRRFRCGDLAHSKHIRVFRTNEIQILTSEHHLVNTDGEITVTTPVYFRVLPQAIPVFVPEPFPD